MGLLDNLGLGDLLKGRRLSTHDFTRILQAIKTVLAPVLDGGENLEIHGRHPCRAWWLPTPRLS